MPIRMHLDPVSRYAEIRIFDRVKWSDFHCVAPRLEEFVQGGKPVRVLEVIERFDGLDPDLLWDGLRLDRAIMPHISHCALVGDLRWLAPLDRAREAVLPMQLRLFCKTQEDAARAWLTRAGAARTHVVTARKPQAEQRIGSLGAQVRQQHFGTHPWG